MFNKSELDQKSIDRMKTIGLYGVYICTLYNNPNINQKKLANLTIKKPSQVSRDIKDLKTLKIIEINPKRNENILSLSPYGREIYRIINPYSQISNIPLTEGVKQDLIELFNEFDINDNDILKNHVFEKIKQILKPVPVSNWTEFYELEEFIGKLMEDFWRNDNYQYQQFPLQTIKSFVEKGYSSSIIDDSLVKYVREFDIQDHTGKDHLIQKIFEIVFISIKIDKPNIEKNIDFILEILIKFKSKNSIRSELFNYHDDLISLDIATKNSFISKIKTILKTDPYMKSSELEYILRVVSI